MLLFNLQCLIIRHLMGHAWGHQVFYETGNKCDFHFQGIDRQFATVYFNSQGCQKSLSQIYIYIYFSK